VGRIEIDNLKVYRQILPERVEITGLADALAENQAYEPAFLHLMEVINNYSDPPLIMKALKKIMAISNIAPEVKAYGRLLARRPMVDKIFLALPPEALKHFAEQAFFALSAAADWTDINVLAAKFAAPLSPDQRFRFDVYAGLFLENAGMPDLAREYFKKALVLKPDSVVSRYVERGAATGIPSEGGMKCLPSGFLPFSFGDCRFVQGFRMDSVEVTRQLYAETMGAAAPSSWATADSSIGADSMGLPADSITWLNAVLFCNQRSKKEGLDSCYSLENFRDTVIRMKKTTVYRKGGALLDRYEMEDFKWRLADIRWDRSKNGYRLPTGDEFEYAVRAGTTTEYFWGNDQNKADEYAWYRDNSGGKSHPVARKKPNRFGLYDIIGNLEEWSWDHEGVYYMNNGRNFMDYPGYLMSANRGLTISGVTDNREGLRCARNVP
jgi:tetratricopeptide (TPR) repeat protein